MKRCGKRLLQIISLLVIIFIISQCANPTSPTGGPKDITPPRALKFDPENYQAHFSSQTATILFDEYFVLENVNENIIISPFINPKPEFKTKGKSLIIDFKNCELQENTTYSIWFGEAIKDLNERNILNNFYYVFSTGDFVDSLEISGKIIAAFDLQAKQKVFVMLYACENDTIPCDSLPYLVRPDYVTQTLTDGSFALRNLADKPYRIFSINDANKNFLYDLGEEIAFVDSLILPKAVCKHDHHHEQDSLLQLPADTLAVHEYSPNHEDHDAQESLPTDSLTVEPHRHEIAFVDMFMFLELDSTLIVKGHKVLDTTKLQIVFSCPAQGASFATERSKLENLPDTIPWVVEKWTPEKDTTTLWFPYFKNDSVTLHVLQKEMPIDTLIFSLKELTAARTPRRGSEADTIPKPAPKLAISNNAQGKLPFFASFEFYFDTPLYRWDFENSLFFVDGDTLPGAFPAIVPPEEFPQKIRLDYLFKEKTEYKIIVPENAFTNIFGHRNDSLIINFSTDDMSSYGNLKVLLELPDKAPQVILQLLTEKEKLIKQFVVNESGEIDCGYLKPQKVKMKLIYDTYPNGKWDAGNYLRKIQPERVQYNPKLIDIHPNWFVEEPWDIHVEDLPAASF